MIDVFTKYARVKRLTEKERKPVLNVFIKVVNKSNRKPNKLWADQRKEFYNRFLQKWLDDKDLLMYSSYNKGKSIDAERFIKKLKAKIYKITTANYHKSYLSYLNKLADQNHNAYHQTIGKNTTDADYPDLIEELESRYKAPKFKYKNIFSKGFTKNWSREIFLIDSVLKTNPWTYKVKTLDGGKQ